MASFFDNLFGDGAMGEAAERNRGLYGMYGQNANTFLDTGLNRSVGAVTDAANQAGNYFGQNYDLYGNMRNAGNGILDRGFAGSMNALNNAGAAYDPLAALGAEYGRGREMYQNSLGLNGAAGNASAVNAFQTGPGYEFTRDQGLQAINRRRNAGGMLNSGNADIDAMTYGTGLANQTYGSWQDRLQGFVNPELQATSGAAAGRASISRDIAGLYGSDAASRLALEQAATGGQAGSNTAQAGNQLALGNSLGSMYSNDASNRIGVLSNQTSGNAAANNQQATAETQGARNLWGTGMQVAGMALSAATGMPMGGGGGSFGGGGGGGGGQGAPSTLGNIGSQYFGNGTGYQTNPWSSGGAFGPGGAGTSPWWGR